MSKSHTRIPRKTRDIVPPERKSLTPAQQAGWDLPALPPTKEKILVELSRSFDKFFEGQSDYGVDTTEGFRRQETRGKRPSANNEYIDPPAGMPTLWDATTIQQALTSHYQASFTNSGYLVEAMLGDARIAHSLNSRTKGVLKRKPYLTANKRAKDQKMARYVADQYQEMWYDIMPFELQEQIWIWSSLMGWFLGNNVWAPGQEDMYLPQTKLWHPSFQYFLMAANPEERRFNAITMGGGDNPQGAVPVSIGDPEWFLYAPYSTPHEHGYRTWIRGAVRQIAIPWLVRNYSLRDFSRFSEIMGIPIRAVNVPANAVEEDKAEIFNQIVNQASEAVMVLPTAEDGTGYQMQFIESKNAAGYQVFKELAARCDSDIALSIVGTALLSSMGSSDSSTGSFAASKTVQSENYDYAEADAMKFCATVRSQILTPTTVYNYEDGEDLVPGLTLSDEPPQNKIAMAQVLLSLSTSLVNFQQVGADVDLEALSEDFDVPFKSFKLNPPAPPALPGGAPPAAVEDDGEEMDDEDKHAIFASAMTVAHLRKTTELQSLVLSKDKFDLKMATQWCKAHGYMSEVVEAPDSYRFQQRDPGDFVKKSFKTVEFAKGIKAIVGKLTPTDGTDEEESAHTRHLHKRAKYQDGQKYVDAVGDQSVGHAVGAIRPHLDRVKQAVEDAKDPDELRKSLKRIAHSIKKGSLEEVLKNSKLMANLAGRSTEVE